MKFTGKYDKNGKKINVGDKVRLHRSRHEIMWNATKGFYIRQLATGHTFWLEPTEEMEVI